MITMQAENQNEGNKMANLKYIVGIVATPNGPVTGAFLFVNEISHKVMAQKLCIDGRVLGAGYCKVSWYQNKLSVTTYGHSHSLKICSREEDTQFVERVFGLNNSAT